MHFEDAFVNVPNTEAEIDFKAALLIVLNGLLLNAESFGCIELLPEACVLGSTLGCVWKGQDPLVRA